MPTLEFEIEDGSRVTAPLDGRTTIGSAEGNVVVAEREDISPHHAVVFVGMDKTWWVRDNDSATGTFVNGMRVKTQRLSPGDLLMFGSISARFVIGNEMSEAGSPAAPGPGSTAIEPEIEKKKLELSELAAALTRARAEFERTVKEQEARLAALRDESARLEPAMGDKRKQLSGLDAQLATAMAGLEMTMRIEQERIAALRSEAAELAPAVEDKRQEIFELRSGIAEARAGFEKGVKEQEERLVSLRDQAAKLEAAVGNRREDLSRLDGDLKLARAGFEKTVAEQDAHLNAARVEAATLDLAVGSRREDLSRLDGDLARARAGFERTVAEQDAHLNAARVEAATLDLAVGSRREELSKLDGDLKRARAGFEKTVAEQDAHLDAVRAEAARLELAVGSRKQELSILGSALVSAQEDMDKAGRIHESRVSGLQERASRLETDIDRKQQQISGLAVALKEAEKIIEDSRGLVTGVHENRKRREELAASITEAAGRHEAIAQQIRTLSEQRCAKLAKMERLERDLADLEARRADAARISEEQETERRREEESLKQTTLQREQAVAELAKLTGEKGRLADDVRRLGEQCNDLGLEISVLENRRGGLIGVLDGLDMHHSEAVKKLEAAAEELASTTNRHDHLLADIEKESARKAELQAEADQVAAHIRSAQSEAESHNSARENLIALNERLQAEVSTVGNRLAELSGTEERLLEARAELNRTEAAHLSLTTALRELTRKQDAAGQIARELDMHVARLTKDRVRIEEEIPVLKSSYDEAQRKLAAFEREAEESRRAMTGEMERLRADASAERVRLSGLLQEADQAEVRKREFEQQNRELEAIVKRLGEVRAEFRAAELEKQKIEARAQVLGQACSDSQVRLAELESAEKSAGQRISRVTSQETTLQAALRGLGEEQQRMRSRLEELRKLSEDAEREGVRQKERLAAEVAELRGEIARLESRLAHARNWNTELDQLYEKLGRMPDASPEAREEWLEIQRRKSDIAEQLPTGIQVRPKGRPTVVPRTR